MKQHPAMRFAYLAAAIIAATALSDCGGRQADMSIQVSFGEKTVIRQANDVNRAIAALKRKTVEQPSDPAPFQEIASLSLGKGNVEETIVNAQEAVRLKPNLTEGYVLLGQAWFEKENYTLAKDYFIRALELDEKNPGAHFGLANCLYAAKDLAGAAEEYRATLETDPANIRALNNLGGLLLQKGDAAGALKYFRKVVELAPDAVPEVYINEGIACEKTGDRAGAVRSYENYLKYDPSNGSVKRWLEALR